MYRTRTVDRQILPVKRRRNLSPGEQDMFINSRKLG